MKHLYYGSWEYTQTNDPPADPRFVAEYGGKGYLMTATTSGVLAIYYDGTLYSQSRRFRDGETSGRRIHERNSSQC
jgi:hypothetical protein